VAMEVAVMKRVVKLTLLAAAVLPCSAFFTPPAIARAAPRLGSNSHNRCLISDRPQQHGGVIGLCAAQAALPRRPPPPPPKKAAVGAGGASHLKIKDPQLQAGAWREELGLGLNRLSTSVAGSGAGGDAGGKMVRGKWEKPLEKVSRASSMGKEKMRKMRRAAAPPPPMLTKGQWEAAAKIGGAENIKELGLQYVLAVEGEFVVLELDWRRKGASNAEIRKRLDKAAVVQKMAVEQVQLALSKDGSEADTWALQSKVPRPHKGLMFRYLEEAKNDGRVLPMSMVVVEGHSANVVEYKHDALERKLLSMSKGGSNNQRLLSAEQKKGLVPGGRANAASRALPASVRKGTGINVHNRLLAASKPKTPTSQWGKKGKAAKRQGDADSSPSKPKAEMSFLDSLNSY